MSKKYPVVVVGGGIVGATAACAIAQAGIEVALVDVYNPAREWPADPVDIRVSALTRASQNILQAVGAWPAMEQRVLARMAICMSGMQTALVSWILMLPKPSFLN